MWFSNYAVRLYFTHKMRPGISDLLPHAHWLATLQLPVAQEITKMNTISVRYLTVDLSVIHVMMCRNVVLSALIQNDMDQCEEVTQISMAS